MPAIITDKFRIHNSEQFHEAFSESSGNTMYLGIGRPQAFATSTRGDSRTNNEGTDTAPVTPADNINSQHFPYDDMLAAKKITSSDITFAVPRRNWTTGTVYDVYRHDYGEYATGTTTAITSNSGASTLHDATFYILTSARNVYKCLDNNSNANSTVEPTCTDYLLHNKQTFYLQILWQFQQTQLYHQPLLMVQLMFVKLKLLVQVVQMVHTQVLQLEVTVLQVRFQSQ